MVKTMTANDVFELERALETLLEEHLKLPLNLAIKLARIKREASEITEYVATRVGQVIPKIASPDGTELTAQERLLYGGIMASQVEVDSHGLTEDDFSEVREPMAELGVAEKIALLF